MKREILFRGRRIGDDKSRWFYGDLHHTEKDFKKVVEMIDWSTKPYVHKIDSSTIGQYTGIKDKDGTKIFEGDILKDVYTGSVFTVFFVGGGFVVESNPTHFGYGHQNGVNPTESLSNPQMRNCVEDNFEVIGNIHDNKELLK